MRFALALLALLNGGFMLLDGLHVLLTGKYIGPPRPGPWANLFEAAGINVFKLGPLFILWGLLWLGWLVGFWMGQSWAYPFGLVVAALTLWYLPVGTAISVGVIVLLLTARRKLGI